MFTRTTVRPLLVVIAVAGTVVACSDAPSDTGDAPPRSDAAAPETAVAFDAGSQSDTARSEIDSGVGDAGPETATCFDECVGGTKRCGSGGIESCERQPSGCTAWSKPTACASGTVCSTGECRTVKQLAAGDYHACALLSDGAIACWGRNYAGVLGDSTASGKVPVFVKDLPAPAYLIAAGGGHTCAALEDGTIRCWGDNTDGALGDGTTTSSAKPVVVSGASKARNLAAGPVATCAVWGDSSRVYCWGSGAIVGGTPALTPKPITSSATIDTTPLSIAMGAWHACVEQANGKVLCWGANGRGQLGDGTGDWTTYPRYVSGLTQAGGLGAGRDHTCASVVQLSPKPWTLQCWGHNASGQVGSGTTTDALAPITVTEVANPRSIAAGQDHTCVRVEDGTVKCWGSNSSGQIAMSTVSGSKVPVVVGGIGPAEQVVAGADFTGAILRDRAVWCWGDNEYGQLGAGLTKAVSVVPVAVTFP